MTKKVKTRFAKRSPVPRVLSLECLESRKLLAGCLWHGADASDSPWGVRSFVSSTIGGSLQARGNEFTSRQDVDDARQPQTAVPTDQAGSTRAAAPETSAGGAVRWAAAADDVFENNDSWLRAADLGTPASVSSIDNLVMADQADWYRFRLDRTADASGEVSIHFQQALGDLDLAVYDGRGRLVARSNGTSDSEQVPLSGFGAGTYYVLVYGYRGATNPHYMLDISPGNSLGDDSFEDNDSSAQAANLGILEAGQSVGHLVMADGHDWYQFQMNGPGSASNYVGITFQHAEGDLDLAVYDAAGHRVGLSNGVTNSERVSLDGWGAGTYYVHVYGYNAATNSDYTLVVAPGIAVASPPTPIPNLTATPTTGAFQIDVTTRGLTASQQTILQNAVTRWEQVIVGDVPNAVYNGHVVDDLSIDVSAGYIDGPGGILGGANADRFRSGTLLPYHGTIQFDSADLAQMEADGTLGDVILHEIGHVLGIGTIWQARGLLVGAGTGNPRFIGSLATAEYDALTSGNATSVPVENGGGAGTRDAHWRESVFTNELMTGYVGPGRDLPLSRVTVASLADLGYQVDMAAADPFSLA